MKRHIVNPHPKYFNLALNPLLGTSHYALEIIAFHHVHPVSTHFDNNLKIAYAATSLPIVVQPLWASHW